MTTMHDVDGERVAFTKGGAGRRARACAPARSSAARQCRSTRPARAHPRRRTPRFARAGFRTLAFAFRELGDATRTGSEVAASGTVGGMRRARRARRLTLTVERELTYVGILGLVDPPRAEVPAAIAECRRAESALR